MTRTVVSVAIGASHYHAGLQRLANSFRMFDPFTEQRLYKYLPADWPTHKEKPYGFKAFALQEAKNSDSILWCDSVVMAIRQLKPLWERIECDGYFMVKGNGDNNYEWTADDAYPDLFPCLPLERARKGNKNIPQVSAAVIGLNLRSGIGSAFLCEYYRFAKETNVFCGPWTNTNDCGPPDVKGHRHDQTVASVLAWKLGMKLTSLPEPYAHGCYAASKKTILVHDSGGLAEWHYIEEASLPGPIKMGCCTKCGSSAIVPIRSMHHCNQCGHDFKP